VKAVRQPEHHAGIDRFAQFTPLFIRPYNLESCGHGDRNALLDQDVEPGRVFELHTYPVWIWQLHIDQFLGWVDAMGVAVDEGWIWLLIAKAGDGCLQAFLV